MTNVTKVTTIIIRTRQFDGDGRSDPASEETYEMDVLNADLDNYQGVTAIFLTTNSVENIFAKYYDSRTNVKVRTNSPLNGVDGITKDGCVSSTSIRSYWQSIKDNNNAPNIMLKCADSQPCVIEKYIV